jgi:hypothetical protein
MDPEAAVKSAIFQGIADAINNKLPDAVAYVENKGGGFEK